MRNLALAVTLAAALKAWHTEGSWGDGIYEGHAEIYDRAKAYLERHFPNLDKGSLPAVVPTRDARTDNPLPADIHEGCLEQARAIAEAYKTGASSIAAIAALFMNWYRRGLRGER